MKCLPILILLASVLSASTPLLARAADTVASPNIVIVLVDDLRWDELGCTGHPFARTPNIDRIASEGLRFRNAFCTTPLCSPARASLLTGLHTHHHGILDNINRSAQSHQLKTFPQVLQRAGYETAYVGKWHMGNDDSARPGFDHWVSMEGQGTSFDPMLNVDGERQSFAGHTTDVLNAKALAFAAKSRTNPFCLYIAHKALHPELTQRDDGSITDPSAAQFHPAVRHRELYSDAPIPRRLNVTDSLDGKTALLREIEGIPPLGPSTGTDDETVRDRLRMLAAVDEGVGQLLDSLRASGKLEDTVFVFTSDHGYWYGEHGLSVERRLAYEEGIRVPLLIRYPKLTNAGPLRAGSIIDDFAISVDLAPTLIELSGAAEKMEVDGASLVPLLRGETPEDWRKSFLVQYNSDTVFPRVHQMGYRAIRTQRWKLIRYIELDGMNELYDLAKDPYEMRNLIHEPASQSILSDLNLQLDDLLND